MQERKCLFVCSALQHAPTADTQGHVCSRQHCACLPLDAARRRRAAGKRRVVATPDPVEGRRHMDVQVGCSALLLRQHVCRIGGPHAAARKTANRDCSHAVQTKHSACGLLCSSNVFLC